MTNKDLITMYLDGNKKAGACNHLMFTGSDLYNYSTLMCTVNREAKTAKFNTRKYSRTTSKIQGMIRRLLEGRGYSIEEYNGEPCVYWNFGYQGAENWTVADLKKRGLA